MKRFGYIALFLLLASPAWAAKKLTVQQLKDMITSMHQANKSDADVAADLENVELTEELTQNDLNSLAPAVPGQLTTEQLFVLEIRSAALPPPASEIPAAPAPDAATQKAILDKAIDYATKTYAQLPKLTATKAVRRFQDNPQFTRGAVGSHSTAIVAGPTPPIRYTATSNPTVTVVNGIEQNPLATDKTSWGDNGQIALIGQGPALNTILPDAQAAGKLNWLRWQTISGHQFAVFSFGVDKKKTHYAVNYCCFPEGEDAADQDLNLRGSGTIGSATAGATNASQQPGGNAPGNYMPNAKWKPFKAVVPYHGEIFVDPSTGIIVRLITEAEFKGGEPVKVENQIIDFGEQAVGGKQLIVPVRSIIDTLEQPYPDSPNGRTVMRHTLFTAAYKDYQAAGS